MGDSAKPGEFRGVDPEKIKEWKDRMANPAPLEAEPRPDLVERYSLFRETIQLKAGAVVYHPCGENDVSPSSAFPESRVIYVDQNEKAMAALQQAGFTAHTASALEFNPGPVDILIMLNPCIDPDFPASHVVPAGFVLCNDYHKSASSLRENPDYELTGVIRMTAEGLIFDTEKLEDFWKDVETDQEFQNAPFSWGALTYGEATELVREGEKIGIIAADTRKSILDAHKEIIERIIEKAGEQIHDMGEGQMFLTSEDKRTVMILNTALPRKKGAVDDIFVFQKKVTANSQQLDTEK